MDSDAFASSSAESSTAPVWKHDVFLNFRGPDTRKGIASELYDGLQESRIKAFKDDTDLEVGDAISPTVEKAIKESRFAIVVLSSDYASSPWCLEELATICECMEDNNRILPLFYNVDPGDVRHQLKSFGDAFTKHERSGRHRSDKMQKWRNALEKVANFSGWDSKNFKTDKKLLEAVVESVYSRVQPIEINMGDFQEFEATRQAKNEVMKALKDDKVTAVGIYGMPGVGKTSMVKHVGEHSKKKGIFAHWTIGVVSQSPDLIKIQDTLAELLGCKLKKKTEFGRAAELKKEIMRREKILIILDDVWSRSRIELSNIGIPSLKELQSCNSKLLLTTRKESVCYSMGCDAKINLNVLSEEDSWTLFVRNARRLSFESTNFENLARKVAAECGGLPIALIAVARALGDKGLVEWETAARKLENSQPAHPDDEGCAFKCIKLSYDYLTDEDYKSCFLLCCLFPEDYDISIEELFQYAFGKGSIGKGLFRDDDTILKARQTAYTVVAHLKNCSLLLDGATNAYVKMHDVIRDTAVKIAGGEFCVKAGSGLKDWPCQSHGGYSAISVMNNRIRKLPNELACPKLQILSLRGNADLNEISETFFQRPNELRVLDLSDTSVSLLPQSFSLLTNLQALFLDLCGKIMDISILGKLKKLEILRMRRHPPKELSREIGNLTNLRILDISGGIVTIPSKVISKLHRLEELYMDGCEFCKLSVANIEELVGLPKLKVLRVCIADAKCIPENVEGELNLVYFKISIIKDTAWRCFDSDLSWRCFDSDLPSLQHDLYSLQRSRSLRLQDTTIRSLPDWFVIAVARKTEKLEYLSGRSLADIPRVYDLGRLHGLRHLNVGNWEVPDQSLDGFDCSRGLTDILMEYDHGRLHGLKRLTVVEGRCVRGLQVLMNTTTRVQKEAVFEKLEELHLIDLRSLEELCVGELPARSLINLKVFRVKDCQSLGNVSKLLQRLPNLEKLHLYGMKKVEYVFECEGFEPEQSKLREMNLSCLNSLKSICNGPAPRAVFQSLKRLTIRECKLLRSLFPSDVAQCLFQLESLFIGDCPLLERVTEASKKTVDSEKTILPALKKLVMMGLPKLYGGGATVDIECPSLEQLFVWVCPQVSFSTSASASDYFHCRNPVQLNDEEFYRSMAGMFIPKKR